MCKSCYLHVSLINQFWAKLCWGKMLWVLRLGVIFCFIQVIGGGVKMMVTSGYPYWNGRHTEIIDLEVREYYYYTTSL